MVNRIPGSVFLRCLGFFFFFSFILQAFLKHFAGFDLVPILSFHPSLFLKGSFFWQVLTYPLVQPQVLSLFFNLLLIFWIAPGLEQRGRSLFWVFSLSCILFETVSYAILALLLAPLPFPIGALMGLDGWVYGLLGVQAFLYTEERFSFFFLFSLKARPFLLLLAGIETLLQVATRGPLAETLAAISCAGWGIFFFWLQTRSRGGTASGADSLRKSARRASHLRVVSRASSEDRISETSEPKFWN